MARTDCPSCYAMPSLRPPDGSACRHVDHVDRGVDPEPEDRDAQAPPGMTSRQRGILLHCTARGYYDIPRSTTLRSLAGELGISPTTLSLILRRAERSVVRQYVMHDVGTQEMAPLRATADGR